MSSLNNVNVNAPGDYKKELLDRFNKILPDTLVVMAVRLYTLVNLMWQYVDTVCDMSAIRRDEKCKKYVRQVRNLYRDYESFRKAHITSEGTESESRRAESVEEYTSERLSNHRKELLSRLNKLDMSDEDKLYYIACHQALSLLEASLMLADMFTGDLKEMVGWVPRRSILQDEVQQLVPLLRKLLPDGWIEWKDIQLRTARHLAKFTYNIQINIVKEEELTI